MTDPKPTSVQLTRHFTAAPEKIWRAWTDPEIVRLWFGSDPKGVVSQAMLDVQPGGKFEISFRDSDQMEHTCSGIYATVHTGTELAFSWQWKSEPQVESFVTVVLTADSHGTRMDFEHSRLVHASQHDYSNGWQRTFDKLERALGKTS